MCNLVKQVVTLLSILMICYNLLRKPNAVRTLLVATTAMTFLSVRAERTSNSFFTIEGEGVRIASDGSVCVDAGASGPVRITARSGWLVNGRESITYPSARGLSS